MTTTRTTSGKLSASSANADNHESHVVHRQQGATVVDPPRTDHTNAASYWIHGFKESLELEELTNFDGGADAVATLLRHLVDR